MSCNDRGVVGPREGERWTTIVVENAIARSFDFGVAKVGGTKPGRIRTRPCGHSCETEASLEGAWGVVNAELPPQSEYSGEGLFTCIPAGRSTIRLSVDADDVGDFVLGFAPGPEASNGC